VEGAKKHHGYILKAMEMEEGAHGGIEPKIESLLALDWRT